MRPRLRHIQMASSMQPRTINSTPKAMKDMMPNQCVIVTICEWRLGGGREAYVKEGVEGLGPNPWHDKMCKSWQRHHIQGLLA